MEDLNSLVRRPTFILKLVEIVLTIVCAAVVGESGAAFLQSKNYVVSVAIHGFIIIHIIAIASYILKTNLHQFISMGIACVGAVLTFAAGGIMLSSYNSFSLDYLLSAGVIAIINGFVYLVDVFFCFKETFASN